VNAFKKNFEAFVYHVKKDREEITKFTIIKSIVFLSKIFILAKKRYWSTKLKIVAIVWVVKKLHHMIRATKHFIIIWTNHSIIVAIIKQTKMIISNTDKLNFHFVKANMYLSQFDLNVRHKADRDHVILDVLFRLSFFDSEEISEEITEEIAKNIIKKKNDILKNVNVYVEILVKMFLTFKTRFIQTYEIDKKWFALYIMLTTLKTSRAQVTQRMITVNANTSKASNNVDSKLIFQEFFNHEEIEFERRKDVIYHLDRSTSKARLCILKSLMKEIFAMTHDDMFHAEFHRAYATINETFYIRRLSHHLRQYIAYCSQCLLNQIKRHKSYEALNLISSSKISFHTISMNFILVLSVFEKFDTILTVIDKFFKEKLLRSCVNRLVIFLLRLIVESSRIIRVSQSSVCFRTS
jgi:hypothetical protein